MSALAISYEFGHLRYDFNTITRKGTYNSDRPKDQGEITMDPY